MQHIVAPFNEFAANAWHEDIWHAFRLAKHYKNQQLTYQLWSPEPLSTASLSKLKAANLSINLDIQHIQPYRGIVPSDGNLWIMGETHIGPWYDYHQYQNISVIYDNIKLDRFFQHLYRLRKKSSIELDVIHISKEQLKKSGLAGRKVEFGLADIEFWDKTNLPKKILNPTFTVGRISPDLIEWHHYDDPSLYNLLTQENIRVRLAGAHSIKAFIESEEKIEFLEPDNSMEKLISTIDCLICRSSPKKPRNFMPIISLAVNYEIPIIINSKNSLAEHLRQYSKTYIANTNHEIANAVMLLSNSNQIRNQGGDA